MKLVLFSDLHAHPFRPYATILPNGMNSRLADAVSCIEQVHQHAVEIGADLVLFGGDMFHVRKTINVPAFNAVYERMAQFAVAHIPVVMIHGNHDQADKAGEEHSIYAFRSFLNVVDTPGWVVAEGKSGTPYRVCAVPYMEDVERLREVVQTSPPAEDGLKIFLGHLGVQGAVVGADFVYRHPSDPKPEDLNPTAFDVSFLGHYHQHQQVAPNMWYIGAPLQHTWGDKGQDRGFIVFDTETKLGERVPLKAPRFIEVEEGDLQDYALLRRDRPFQDHYVRVVATRPWEEDRRESWRQAVGARSVEVIPQRLQQETSAPRLAVDPTRSFSDLVEEYVRSGLVDVNDLDDDYLIQLGQELLQEAEER